MVQEIWGPDRYGVHKVLNSQAMAIELKLLVRELFKPMRFDQVDGSLLEGPPHP